VNGSEKLTGEASNSVDRLDLNINARALGYIGVDAMIFVSFRAPILQSSGLSWLSVRGPQTSCMISSDFKCVVIE